MRMWNINPKFMCRKHLLGEHVECHMFIGCVIKGKNLIGYLNNGLLELHNLEQRHNKLVKEMLRRGYKHNSPLSQCRALSGGYINREKSLKELINRCPNCRDMYEKQIGLSKGAEEEYEKSEENKEEQSQEG